MPPWSKSSKQKPARDPQRIQSGGRYSALKTLFHRRTRQDEDLRGSPSSVAEATAPAHGIEVESPMSVDLHASHPSPQQQPSLDTSPLSTQSPPVPAQASASDSTGVLGDISSGSYNKRTDHDADLSSTQRRVEYEAILDPSPHNKGVGLDVLKWAFKGLEKVAESVPLLSPLKTAAGLAVDAIERVESTTDVNLDIKSMLTNLEAVHTSLKACDSYTSRHVQLAVDDLAKAIETRISSVQIKLDRWYIKKMWDASADAKSVAQEFRGINRALEVFQVHVHLNTNQMVADLREDGLYQRLRHVPEAEAGCGGRAKCMQGTRMDLLRDLLSWAKDPKTEPVFWLNGMAGTGKTTIAETLAHMLEERNLLAASFFCSRASTERNNIKRIFPSLAYTLALSISEFRVPLIEAIMANQNVAHRDPLEQFDALIGGPLQHVRKRASVTAPKIVIVDALDECESPDAIKTLLEIILARAPDSSSTLKFFVSSRPELRIREAFNHDQAGLHSILHLHEVEKSIIEADIRLYMTKRLGNIGALLEKYSHNWPPPEVDSLIKRAGNLFIYASTLCAYIGEGNADPLERFQMILSAPQEAQLDAIANLYAFVLDSALKGLQDGEIGWRIRLLEVIVFARNPLSLRDMASLLSLDPRRIRAMLATLHSVIQLPQINDDEMVVFYHASFPDYLTGPARSGNRPWAVDLSEAHSYLLERCLEICQSELHFNVAQVFDSRVEQVEGSHSVLGHLAYACQYWGEHLFALPDYQRHLDPVQLFIYKGFLFWLEVMITLNALSVALVHVRKLEKSPHASLDLTAFAGECRSFIIAYNAPLSFGPAHIYLSALPWLPRDSRLWKTFGQLFPGIPAVQSSGTLPELRLPVLRIEGHTNDVKSAAFSPDGQFVVSGSHDTTVRVWNATTGEAVFTPLRGHTDKVNSVAVSPDGKWIASGSDDCTLKIWDVKSGKAVGHPLKGHIEGVTSVAFSSDGKMIVSGSSDRTIRTWHVESTEELSTPFIGHTGSVRSVTFSSDSRYIISGSMDETVGVWDVRTGKTLYQPLKGHTDYVRSVACSPDGSCIASGSNDNTIIIWSLMTGQLLLGPLRGHTSRITSIAFSPHGQQIISSSRDNTIRIWDSVTGKEVSTSTTTAYIDWVNSVQFSSNGQYIVSASGDRTICIWEAIASPSEPFPEHADAVACVAFSPNGKEVISGSWDKTVRRWTSETADASSNLSLRHADNVNSVAVSPDGQFIASGSDDGTVWIWNVRQGHPLFEPLQGHTSSVLCIAISSDGNYIVSGSADNTIRVWNALTGQTLGEPLRGHTGDVNAVSASPDSQLIVSGSDDRTVRIWNAMSHERYSKPFKGHTNGVSSALFSRDGKKIISGSWDKTIRLWDVATGATLLTLEGHTDAVSSISISLDGEWIVSGSDDRTVRLWSTSTGKALSAPLIGHSNIVTSVAISPDGQHVISGSYDRMIRKWDVGLARGLFREAADNAGNDTAGPEGGDDAPRPPNIADEMVYTGQWVFGHNQERLFWVPPKILPALRLMECNTAVIGVPYNIPLDLSQFVHGKDWAKCYKPESRT